MELTKEQRVLQQIINEAWDNEAFRKELVVNPIEAIEKLTGQEVRLPDGKKLVVRDQMDETIVYINIPAEQNLEDVELNEEQLETIAGGHLPFTWPDISFIGQRSGEDGGGTK